MFTNTVPVDAYRGAGRPEATYLLERLVDTICHDTGHDRVEIRRKNFIPVDAFPYQTPVALQYDSGDYFTTLKVAMQAADWDGFEARRGAAKARGKLRGIGMSTYLEACGIAPSKLVGQLGARAGLYEVANVRVHPTGSVSVFTGSHSHGQGHETTFAQLVVEQLGIPFEQIDVVHGDTAKIPFGMGTYGSRSLAVGGSAMVKAMDKIVAKGKKIAAHLMEAAVEDIAFKDGKFSVAGTDKFKTIAEIALTAYVPHNYPIETLEPGLDETAFYDPMNFTFLGGLPYLRGRDRSRHGHDAGDPVRRRRRYRPRGQPDDRGRPGAGRRRPGHRAGAAGKRRIRCRRAASVRFVHGLYHAKGG